MSQIDSQKQALYSQLYSIESDLSRASSAINEARNNVASVEGAVGSLPSRLSSIRGRGYAAVARLETDIESLTKGWNNIAPTVKLALSSNVEPLTGQVGSLQAEARSLRSQIDSGNISYSHTLASRLSPAASALSSRASSEADRVNIPLKDLSSSVKSIDGDLKIAETTLTLFSQASFPLKEGESQILAFDGKIMKGDKSQGTLYFTNQRFIFEAKKEIVLEKKLFIVTKKKTERTVVIDQPIGALQEIAKGRVGFIAWTGIYVRFKPGTRAEETQFDVEGWEADAIIKFFDYITNGEADRDIAKIKGPTAAASPSKQPISCPRCFAPYTREVYQGQKTVQCEYCGSQIVIQ